jgi:tetratricopeptide (TPR) repeat protein
MSASGGWRNAEGHAASHGEVSHGVWSFVRSARILLVFQLLAAAAAVGVTGWAALRVRPLLEQRDTLRREIEADTSRARELAAEVATLDERARNLRNELEGARAATPLLSQAINAFHAKRYSDAIAKYDAAIAVNPGDAYIHNLKSYSQFKVGDVSGAAQTMARALQLDPTYDWGYFDLARYQCAGGASQAALGTLRDAVQRRGDSIRNAAKFFLAQDGEFRRLCADIRNDIAALADGASAPAPNR